MTIFIIASVLKAGEDAARKTEEPREQIDAKREKQHYDDDGCNGMLRRKPGEPDGEQVFANTQSPVSERLGNGVRGGARAGFRAVRGEGHATGDKGRGPAPFGGSATRKGIGENPSSGRAYECVQDVPDVIEVRNLVSEKFEKVQTDGETDDDRMREDLERLGQMDDAEALEEPEGAHGGIEVEAGGKSRAESHGEDLNRIHVVGRVSRKKFRFQVQVNTKRSEAAEDTPKPTKVRGRAASVLE